MSDKKSAAIRACLQPQPNVLVSCRSVAGEDNALAVGYCCNCSYDPPMLMVGIVPSRYSHPMIKETGVFVVNLVPKNLSEQFNYLGSVSGRTEKKLEKSEMRIAEGLKVSAPVLLDCPVNIECRVVGSMITGSHEMFAARIEYVHADADLLDEKGQIDFSKIELL